VNMSTQDLQLAFKVLKAKQDPYNTLFQYYDGEQPLVYTATRLKDIFKDLDAYFAENWCSVVVDSTRDRINLREINVQGSAQKRWKEIWEASEISLESDDVHEAALVAGEGYFIAWPDEDDLMQGYHNDPRLVHLFYYKSEPRKKKFAAKWWVDEGEKLSMTLYYADHLEYYRSRNKAKNVQEFTSLEPLKTPTADNPYGQVPVFHYRLGQRKVKSDLKNVVPIQNGINKLLTDMMVAAEYGAFPQRYVISNATVNGKLKNAPSEIWDLPAGDGIGQQTQAGQFAATQLDNYLKGIDDLATAISSITRTPKHYFFSIGSNLSGEALIAMEAPLNKKAQDRIDRFIPVWKQVTLFMLTASGEAVKPEEVNAMFDKPETVQPYTQAQTRQLNVTAGMPLVTILREEGKSEAFINQMQKDKAEEDTAKQTSLAKSMLEAERRFNAGNLPTNVNGENAQSNPPSPQPSPDGRGSKVTNA
jgi:SPP1 Gp6-like portal protein